MFEIDGIHYADLQKVNESFRVAMVARRLVWETEFEIGGTLYCGNVIAKDEEEATKIADARGLGERVVGPWVEPAN